MNTLCYRCDNQSWLKGSSYFWGWWCGWEIVFGYKKESQESFLHTNILLSLHTNKKGFFEPNNKHYFGVCVCVCVCTLGLRTLKDLGPPQKLVGLTLSLPCQCVSINFLHYPKWDKKATTFAGKGAVHKEQRVG
jgi:hypothetical protein